MVITFYESWGYKVENLIYLKYLIMLLPFVLIPLAIVIFSFFVVTIKSNKLLDKMLSDEISFGPALRNKDI
jgi:hypothetical protein